VDAAGNLYFADTANHSVRKVLPNGTIVTVAGNVLAGFSGDGGPATVAQLDTPTAVAVDTAGNLYIADTGNNRIRKVFPNGLIGTVAGNGNAAFFGDLPPRSTNRAASPSIPRATSSSPIPAATGSAGWMAEASSTPW
jgi:hypothetical protein